MKLTPRATKPDGIAWNVVLGDEVIGFVSVCHIDMKHQYAHVAYEIDISHRRKGLATAAMRQLIIIAFGDMALHRLEAHIDPKNEPSLKLAEGLGFVREGYLRENYLEGDGFHDTVLFALLNRPS